MIINQEMLREKEKVCTQDDQPACMSKCPIHVDGRELCRLIQEEKFTDARTMYEKTVVFPEIISRICEENCRLGCKRKALDDSLNLRLLERIVMTFGSKVKQRRFIPKFKGKIAIIGSGLTALSLSVELKRKGCDSEIFEKKGILGGRLWEFPEKVLPKSVIEKELAVLKDLEIKVNLNQVICFEEIQKKLEEGFDAVFVASKIENNDFIIDPLTFETQYSGIFASLPILKPSPCLALGYGKKGAISIDRYLQKVSMVQGRETEGAFETKLFTNISKEEIKKPVFPENKIDYTKGEAIEEGKRCLSCECLECVKGCSFLQYFKTYPKKLLRETYNNLSIVMGTRFANKMINSCSLCKQCEAICPNGFDMGEICEAARQAMTEKKKMPPSAFEFAVLDMTFSNSDEFFTVKHEPGKTESEYVYFPGCQLSASGPELVKESYTDLRTQLSGGVGLILGCCGAIGKWTGNENLFKDHLLKIEAGWVSLGRPKVITACPTCYEIFKEVFSEMEVKSLWESISFKKDFTKKEKVSVHDSCTSRFNREQQEKIRELLKNNGYTLQELEYTKDKTTCCGFGGLTKYSNPLVEEKILKDRVKENQLAYVTYCINCREGFVKEGKESYHLLELLYNKKLKPTPTGISERRYARVALKNDLLKDLWKVTESLENPYKNTLIISEELKEILEKRMILTSDIRKSLEYLEKTQRKIKDVNSGQWVGYHQIGNVTFWVWYLEEKDGFRIFNAYSHRMEIEVK